MAKVKRKSVLRAAADELGITTPRSIAEKPRERRRRRPERRVRTKSLRARGD